MKINFADTENILTFAIPLREVNLPAVGRRVPSETKGTKTRRSAPLGGNDIKPEARRGGGRVL